MPMAIVCGGCKRKLRIPDKLIGKPVQCPGCSRKLKVGSKTVLQANTAKKETVVVTTPKKESAGAKASAASAAKKSSTTAKKTPRKPPANPTGSMPKPTFASPPAPAPRSHGGSGKLVLLGGGGVLVMLVALAIGYSVFVGFNSGAAPKKGVVPDGLDENLLNTLKCPENGSSLRFADQKELDAINLHIHAGTQKNWAGAPVTEPVEAVLVRADSKIGYRVDNRLPIMELLSALVLDESVGEPDPNQNRK